MKIIILDILMAQFNHDCHEAGRLRQKTTPAILCDERVQSISASFEDEDRCLS